MSVQKSNRFYIDLNSYNSSNSQYMSADFSQNYSQDIIKNPSEWCCSVTSFSLPLLTVPLINFGEYFSTFPNSILEITFSFSSINYTVPLIWTNLPGQSGFADFYIYTYQRFLDLMNVAFESLKTLVNNASPGTIANTPFITYNNSLKIFEIFCDPVIFSTSLVNPVFITFNNVLFDFFASFPVYTFSPTSSTLKVFETPQNVRVFNSITYWAVMQESSQLCLFNTVRSVYFTSSLPIVSEYINVNSYQNNQSSNTSSQNILTNFNIDAMDNSYVCLLTYSPTAEFRRVDLEGTQPINGIKIGIYWVSKNGQSYKLSLSPKSGMSCKIYFERKNFIV